MITDNPVHVLTLQSDVSSCGQYERIYSDYEDYVSTSSFLGKVAIFPVCIIKLSPHLDHATVKRYDERDIHQNEFDDDDFFHRYNLEYRARRIIVSTGIFFQSVSNNDNPSQPKVSTSACHCNVSYNPDRDPVMHFCPRPMCRLAFHQGCLQTCKQKESNTSAWNLRLLECWPDTDRKLSVHILIRRQKGSGYSASDPLKDFPEELVKAAQQQIVKGVQAGGVVGNVKAVVAARRLIYKALLDGSTLPTDWMDQVDVDTAIPTEEFPGFMCPQCKSPI